MKKLLLLALVLTGMASSASATMYIVGDAPFGGWNTNVGTAMTDNNDGTYSYEYTPASDVTVWFCIASALTTNAGDWDTFNPNSFRPSNSGTKYVQFEPITLSSTDGANSAGMDFKRGVTYTFKFTENTKELIVLSNEIPDLYLRSNLDATSENRWKTWDAAFSELGDYKFTSHGWHADYKKLYYTYNVTSAQLAAMVASGQSDLYFRIQNDDADYQMRPSGDHTFSFSSDGKYSVGYDGYSNNGDYTGTSSKFIVSHSSLKAAEYKISVYVAYANWGRTYSTNVEIVSMPVTLSAAKGTFSCDRALNFSGKGINAYMITGASNGVLTLSSAMTLVPAGTGLYLEGTAGTVNVPVITKSEASEISTTGNMLKPGTGEKIYQTDGDKTNFILTTNKGASATPKFYKVNKTSGNTVGVGKAYLQIPTATVGAREFFWFDEESGTTSISEELRMKSEEFATAPIYNLNGQRVAQPTKGLYIVNGKKAIMK